MHYSQKRRYYFFIAIAKFKTILSYYPRWRKLSTPTLANFQSLPKLIAPPMLNLRSTFAQPSLNLRSTFAQPSLNLRSTFAQPSLMIAPHLCHTCATLAPHLHHTCTTLAPHTLANFQSLPKLISCLAGASSPPNAYPSSHTRLCQLADFPSIKVRSRFALAGASLQFVPNSKFIIQNS